MHTQIYVDYRRLVRGYQTFPKYGLFRILQTSDSHSLPFRFNFNSCWIYFRILHVYLSLIQRFNIFFFFNRSIGKLISSTWALHQMARRYVPHQIDLSFLHKYLPAIWSGLKWTGQNERWIFNLRYYCIECPWKLSYIT